MADTYLQEGVAQAASARQAVDGNWADTWKDYAVQYALARQQNDENLRLWDLMNEYNSPANQMQRFKEAGLNPYLIYQQGNPGNAGSQATVAKPDVKISPSRDTSLKIQQASEVIGMVSNLAQNINNLINSGLDTKLKQNEVAASNFERRYMEHTFPFYGGTGPIEPYYNFTPEVLNPMSDKFDPYAFMAFQKTGNLPTFWNNYLTGISQRQLNDFKSSYQKYYNENLLPKFNEYQQGKINLQSLEYEMESYQNKVMQMMPPELRGILEPLVQFVSPFIKFIFKSSNIRK